MTSVGRSVLAVSVVILGLGGWVAKITVGKNLVLGASLKAVRLSDTDFASLLGREGVAMTPLRPAGIAKIEGTRVDVTAAVDFVEAGTRVVVEKVEGGRVRVAPVSDPLATAT